jgi:hypothetical protein
MANFLRTLAVIEEEPTVAARLIETATALDGCARQVGTVNIFQGEIEAMRDKAEVLDAHEHGVDGFPPAPRC